MVVGKVTCFEDLIIWQKAIEFAREIYLITERKELKTDFGFKSQLRNAAVSISNNIAEGFERRSRTEYLNYLNIAKGSAGESRSMLYLARDLGVIDDIEHDRLKEMSKFLSGSITNHMNAVASAPN